VWDEQRDKPMNGRCKLHGGLSTGAKTEEGRRQTAGRASRRVCGGTGVAESFAKESMTHDSLADDHAHDALDVFRILDHGGCEEHGQGFEPTE
jgi:hypothetical protein